MKKTVLIVEDNEKSRKMLVAMLREIDAEIVVLETGNIDTAYRYAMQSTIDLFLLDIVLDISSKGDASGIVFAGHMREVANYKTTPIIFITSLEDPKLFAYSEIHCYQYIEKPFDVEKAIGKIREALDLKTEENKCKRICFRKEGLLFPVKVNDIVYIFFDKPMMDVFLVNDTLRISYQSLKKLLLELNSPNFVQSNRNVVININYIDNIDSVNGFIK